jgi:hypothetical protein
VIVLREAMPLEVALKVLLCEVVLFEAVLLEVILLREIVARGVVDICVRKVVLWLLVVREGFV